eukprot:scaffold275157_cov18-Tisochrysis_lutea.AAC.1
MGTFVPSVHQCSKPCTCAFSSSVFASKKSTALPYYTPGRSGLLFPAVGGCFLLFKVCYRQECVMCHRAKIAFVLSSICWVELPFPLNIRFIRQGSADDSKLL